MIRLQRIAASLAVAAAAGPLAAHQEGSPFSGALIDPLVLHHAHIENEQRVNFSFLRGVQGVERRRNALEAELELAWASSRFDFGMEAFVPFARLPSPEGPGSEAGIGDVELRPVKYAFLNRPDLVVSTAVGIALPTGDRARGLGSGNTTWSQYLFVDKAWGRWFAGLNFSVDKVIGGGSGSGYGYGAVASYTFLRDGAPVLSPSVEWIGSRRWSGPHAGERSVSRVLGMTLWWPQSGWQLHLGLQTPVSGAQEADRTFLIQLGNHRDWRAFF